MEVRRSREGLLTTSERGEESVEVFGGSLGAFLWRWGWRGRRSLVPQGPLGYHSRRRGGRGQDKGGCMDECLKSRKKHQQQERVNLFQLKKNESNVRSISCIEKDTSMLQTKCLSGRQTVSEPTSGRQNWRGNAFNTFSNFPKQKIQKLQPLLRSDCLLSHLRTSDPSLNSAKLSLFILYTTTSVTFHMYNSINAFCCAQLHVSPFVQLIVHLQERPFRAARNTFTVRRS